eukprot:scaffold7032_cov246-Pinguiococcus_pyrenoidosus.AAC.2
MLQVNIQTFLWPHKALFWPDSKLSYRIIYSPSRIPTVAGTRWRPGSRGRSGAPHPWPWATATDCSTLVLSNR